jgi:antitoxin component HigA of HigAB toxin-antitoxin module
MTLKTRKSNPQTVTAIQQAATAAILAPAPVAVRRIYMDITGHVDAALEALAKSKGISKKAAVEAMILASVQPQDLTLKIKGRK